VYKSKTSIVGF